MDSQTTESGHKTQGSASPQHSPAADRKPLAEYTPSADRNKKKNKKKRYTSGTKGAQTFERRISKSAHRVSKAVERGLREYLDDRAKSSEKRRDGAVIESYVNIAKGISGGIADASPALTDVAKAINSKRTRKVLRGVMKTITLSR